MNNYTFDQKKAIILCNRGISEFMMKVIDDSYGATPSYLALKTWIGQVLNLDFQKDIYDDPHVTKLAKSYKGEFRSRYPSASWFIGDALFHVLYDLTCKTEAEITEKLIESAENELKEMWTAFKVMSQLEADVYEPYLIVNGEQLYRKIVRKA